MVVGCTGGVGVRGRTAAKQADAHAQTAHGGYKSFTQQRHRASPRSLKKHHHSRPPFRVCSNGLSVQYGITLTKIQTFRPGALLGAWLATAQGISQSAPSRSDLRNSCNLDIKALLSGG